MRISRQGVSLTFPAAFQLVVVLQPVPVRVGGQRVPLQRRAARALPASAERSAPRPVRPPGARRRARVARRAPASRRPRWRHGSQRRVRATTRPLRRLALVAERARRRRARCRGCCPLGRRSRRGVARPHRRPPSHRARRHPDPSGGAHARRSRRQRGHHAPHTSSRLRACGETCRERARCHSTRSRRGGGGDAGVAARHDPSSVAGRWSSAAAGRSARSPVWNAGWRPRCCARARPPRELPARQSLARAWQAAARGDRTARTLVARRHAGLRRRAAGVPARRRAARATRGAAGRG